MDVNFNIAKKIICKFLILLVVTLACAVYVLPPLSIYRYFGAQNFDFAIQIETIQRLSDFQHPYIFTRGLLAWADNQDYINFLLAAIYSVIPSPEFMIVLHSIGIFFVGFIFLFQQSLSFSSRLGLAVFIWLSPILIHASQDIIHPESFATIFLALMFISIRFERKLFFICFWLLAVACKEDVAVTISALLSMEILTNSHKKRVRQLLFIALFATIAIFLFNLLVVVPSAKNQTSDWLCGVRLPSHQAFGHTSPWFGSLGTRIFTVDFYKNFFSIQSLKYILLVIWPLLLLFRLKVLKWTLVILPALLINLIGGAYLIQARYHYDHSTFAIVVICILDLIYSGKLRRFSPLLLLVGLGITTSNGWYEQPVMNPYHILKKNFWNIDYNPRTKRLLSLSKHLHNDIIISSDYMSSSYLANGRRNSFMFPNPMKPVYFGVYGSCDGSIIKFKNLPTPDLVVVREEAEFNNVELEALKDKFYLVDPNYQLNGFRVYLSQETNHKDLIYKALLVANTSAK